LSGRDVGDWCKLPQVLRGITVQCPVSLHCDLDLDLNHGSYGTTNTIAIRPAILHYRQTKNGQHTNRRDRKLKHSCNKHTKISGVVLIFLLTFLSFLFCQRFIIFGRKRSVKIMTKCAKHFFSYNFFKLLLPVFIFARTFFIYEMIEHASVTLACYYTEIY